MDETPVLVDRRSGFWVLTLNRPQRLNSFTQAMHVALMKALDEAQAQGCRALLITGAGRGFCAGQDLSDPIAKGDLGDTIERYYNPLLRKLRNLPFPTVAGVNGVAAGAGANIAFACDIVLAARSANFTQAFAKIGLVPDSGGTWLLPRLAGSARARGLALLAEPLSAEKAESWGLIWKAVDDDKLIAEAEKICAQFGNGPTFGLAQIKRALDAAETNDFATQLDLERDLQRAAGRSPDYAEGVKAFMEKRAPVFTGKES
ncbi:2-(1,2-epoxy-1,2-dihydrophenyl)acetyl-CoA isomerase PaaG [Microbacteriaceae bacterium K1510]|nr:2-(1,2-epoxy-1,2-dihydrophenyl)acetyl-CoA isomerase PaaG [Microbacteriaceae bacterium K1510]